VAGHQRRAQRLTGEAQRRYVIEASSDLKAWTSVSTNVMAGDSIDSADPDASQYQYRFYWALEQE
jgi:hypothetical protein